MDVKESTERLASWQLRPLKFDLTVVNRPSMYHQAADAMSRLSKQKTQEEAQVDDKIPI